VPTVPAGSDVVVIDNGGGAAITMLKFAVAVTLLLSVSCTVKSEVPAALGVPLITPVPDASDNPAGSEPDVIAHVYGAIPPAPVSVAEYAVPTVPLGSDVVVIVGSATSEIFAVAVASELFTEVAVSVTVVAAVMVVGAVYVTLVVVALVNVPTFGDIDHDTPWSLCVAVAVNTCVLPASSVTVAGLTVTTVFPLPQPARMPANAHTANRLMNERLERRRKDAATMTHLKLQ
jgi:hypothetical protein